MDAIAENCWAIATVSSFVFGMFKEKVAKTIEHHNSSYALNSFTSLTSSTEENRRPETAFDFIFLLSTVRGSEIPPQRRTR